MGEKGQHVVLTQMAAIDLVTAMAAFAEVLGMEYDREQALARARQDDSRQRRGLVVVVALPEQAGNAGLFHDLVGLLIVSQPLKHIQHRKIPGFAGRSVLSPDRRGRNTPP